jgi:DNA-binding LacI/PurR family transcriptional regulator
VSWAINNTAPVSAEVRRNVLDAMRDAGFDAHVRNGRRSDQKRGND